MTGFVAQHPRAVLFTVLLVAMLASQGTVSAETLSGVNLTEPTAGAGASTGP